MRIMYDDSKKRLIDSGLEETSSSLKIAKNFADGIRVPYGFGRANDISVCISALNKASNTVALAQKWVTNTNNKFNNKSEANKSTAINIENKKITKKQLLVK